ncbi:MAG: XRE family transcriptional regulator [Devosia sp.]|uniref:XRE family transcriptional regulator n=1 Tax=Devosia sp. TaxID=1871048 RepID=UPI0024C9C601|nr:XRE family transcriptional regulator [Devosia sp.]UYO00193.1 MAG: XRE family transcriptional regulator [Devosia sp.]
MTVLQDAVRTRPRPKCWDPIREQAAGFVNRERTKQRLKSAELARRIGIDRELLTKKLSKTNRGEFEDIGVEFLFRCVEALGYEVKVEIVPKGKAVSS